MFNYTDKNQEYINREMDARLGELTAGGLIKSEEEYRKAIQGYLDRIESNFGRITSESAYVVKTDEVVTSQKMNALFQDLETDVRILHQELRDAHKVLDITLDQNKVFFRRIKNKLSGIWKEINLFRETSYNVESGEYVFFESFDAMESPMVLRNLSVDRKMGVLHLKPVSVDSHNESKDIQEVVLSLYPPENRDGGIYETTHPANKIVENYSIGNRLMMREGLWKVQILSADVPETVLDPLGRGTSTAHYGLVAYLDITFTTQKLFNEIGIDPYGEFPTKVLGVQYKRTLDGSWETAVTTDDAGLTSHVTGEDSDWIYLRNITPVYARVIRLILHQENCTTVSKMISSVNTMVDKMLKDMQERRYTKSYYNYKFLDEMPRVCDTDKERASLYDEILKVIEEEGHIDDMESRIGELLIPKPMSIEEDIQNWKVYNIGAWSIEPKQVLYAPSAVGEYISHDTRNKESGFRLDAGAATEATLYTRQVEPQGTFVEWSLILDNKTDTEVELPILPNDDIYRTEVIRYNQYYPFRKFKSSLTNRSTTTMRNLDKMIKLSFPMHPKYISEVILYENGKEIVNENAAMLDVRGRLIEMYNSTELYIPDIELKNGYIYALKYVPAILDTVKCWTLVPAKDPPYGYVDVGSTMVFASEALAKVIASMLMKLDLKTSGAPSYVTKSDSYGVQMQLCTKQEYDTWFLGGRVGLFIDLCIDTKLFTPGVDWLIRTAAEYNSAITKFSWLFGYSQTFPKPYSDDTSDPYTWNEFISAPPLVTAAKKQYEW